MGPFAASITNLQFKFSALDLFITLASAAGIKKSHFKFKISSLLIFLPSLNPSKLPFFLIYSMEFFISIPDSS